MPARTKPTEKAEQRSNKFPKVPMPSIPELKPFQETFKKRVKKAFTGGSDDKKSSTNAEK